MAERHTIRPREDADLRACADTLIDVHRTDGYPVEGVADAPAWLWPTGLLQAWVAELDGAVVGHIALAEPTEDDAAATIWTSRTTEPVGVLCRLFVLSTARGFSLGEKLIHAGTGYAAGGGLRVVGDVMAKDRRAIRLYERLDWERIGSTGHDDGHGNTIHAYCYVAPKQQWKTPGHMP